MAYFFFETGFAVVGRLAVCVSYLIHYYLVALLISWLLAIVLRKFQVRPLDGKKVKQFRQCERNLRVFRLSRLPMLYLGILFPQQVVFVVCFPIFRLSRRCYNNGNNTAVVILLIQPSGA